MIDFINYSGKQNGLTQPQTTSDDDPALCVFNVSSLYVILARMPFDSLDRRNGYEGIFVVGDFCSALHAFKMCQAVVVRCCRRGTSFV